MVARVAATNKWASETSVTDSEVIATIASISGKPWSPAREHVDVCCIWIGRDRRFVLHGCPHGQLQLATGPDSAS